MNRPNMQRNNTATYFAGEDEAEEYGDGELAVAKEDDVEQVWIGRMLEEEHGDIEED